MDSYDEAGGVGVVNFVSTVEYLAVMETPEGIRMRDFVADNAATTPEVAQNPSADQGLWLKHIRITIDEAECRDHFALDRTFLAYIRTASAYAQVGVTLAQLFRLNNYSSNGGRNPTSLKFGNALGAATECVAIGVSLVGFFYFLKQQ